MSDIYVDANGILSIADQLQIQITKLQSVFQEQNANFEMINLSSIWSSNSQGACYSKYKEISKQYDNIIKSLNTYAVFLKNTANAYQSLDDTISAAASGGGN